MDWIDVYVGVAVLTAAAVTIAGLWQGDDGEDWASLAIFAAPLWIVFLPIAVWTWWGDRRDHAARPTDESEGE